MGQAAPYTRLNPPLRWMIYPWHEWCFLNSNLFTFDFFITSQNLRLFRFKMPHTISSATMSWLRKKIKKLHWISSVHTGYICLLRIAMNKLIDIYAPGRDWTLMPIVYTHLVWPRWSRYPLNVDVSCIKPSLLVVLPHILQYSIEAKCPRISCDELMDVRLPR